MMRELVERQEKKAYYQKGIVANVQEFKTVFNARIEKYVRKAFLTYEANGDLDTFLKTFTYNNVLVTESDDGEFHIKKPFPTN